MVKPTTFALVLVLLGLLATQVAATGDPPSYPCAADEGMPPQPLRDYSALQEDIVQTQELQHVLDSLEVPPFVVKNGLVVVLIVDAGEEIDDESAIAFLARFGTHLYKIERLIVVFVNGKMTAQERIEQWKSKFSGSIAHAPLVPEYVAIDDVDEIIKKTSFDVVIQIAPLHGNTSFMNVDTREYHFGGDFPTPEGAVSSFNLNGSDAVLSQMQKNGKLHTISSSLMAQMRYSDKMLMMLGNELTDAVIFTSFKLAISRMDPRDPIAKKFAEGLVHLVPRKTRGANYNTVKNLFRIFTEKELEHVSAEVIGPDSKYYKLAQRYFRDIYGDAYLLEMTYGEEAIMSLARINYALEKIVPGIWEDRERVISGSFADELFDGDVCLQTSYKTYKQKTLLMLKEEQRMNIYNPPYDLYAVVRALEKENAPKTPQEFYQYFKNLNVPKDSADEPMADEPMEVDQ